MKSFNIVAAMALASLSCQRKDETGPEKELPSASMPAAAADSMAASAPDEKKPDERATKAANRPPNPEKKIWVAEPVADRPGYVKSPFSGKIIDVSGIPAGRMVADPMYPPSEKKYFRIPEMPEPDEQDLVEDSPEEELKKQNAPVGRVLPGKSNFIFNPHNNQILDVGGIAPGTLLLDPTSPPGETRYIRIPGGSPPEMDGNE
ncbi:hypothetical protein [Luteolibacter marinus]|uniref:hypothetical protein n=1 Tax=Luteolibacter marinus TaxID=2776705 RepID=UPI001868AB97|nr:hypothetical protein [Luteolibacter marinus]